MMVNCTACFNNNYSFPAQMKSPAFARLLKMFESLFYAALLINTKRLTAPKLRKNKSINIVVPILNFSRGASFITPSRSNTVFIIP